MPLPLPNPMPPPTRFFRWRCKLTHGSVAFVRLRMLQAFVCWWAVLLVSIMSSIVMPTR